MEEGQTEKTSEVEPELLRLKADNLSQARNRRQPLTEGARDATSGLPRVLRQSREHTS